MSFLPLKRFNLPCLAILSLQIQTGMLRLPDLARVASTLLLLLSHSYSINLLVISLLKEVFWLLKDIRWCLVISRSQALAQICNISTLNRVLIMNFQCIWEVILFVALLGSGAIEVENEKAIREPFSVLWVFLVTDLREKLATFKCLDTLREAQVSLMEQQCFDKTDKHSHTLNIVSLEFDDVSIICSGLILNLWEKYVKKVLSILLITLRGYRPQNHVQIEEHLAEIITRE